VSVSVRRGGIDQSFTTTAAIETALEVELLVEGGILPCILRRRLPGSI
jgi:hypothetical protein